MPSRRSPSKAERDATDAGRRADFAKAVLASPVALLAGVGAAFGAAFGWPSHVRRVDYTIRSSDTSDRYVYDITLDVTLLGPSLFPKLPLPKVEGGWGSGSVSWVPVGFVPDTFRIVETVDLAVDRPDIKPGDPGQLEAATEVAFGRARSKFAATSTAIGALLAPVLARVTARRG